MISYHEIFVLYHGMEFYLFDNCNSQSSFYINVAIKVIIIVNTCIMARLIYQSIDIEISLYKSVILIMLIIPKNIMYFS